MTGPVTAKPLLQVARGKRHQPPPAWLMRQAGRYLPEYREVRARAGSFLDLCFAPEMAAEVTLQPIRRFGFDAAILFADILLLPHALGRKVSFVEGEGPNLPPMRAEADVAAIEAQDPLPALAPVFDTVAMVRQGLPEDCTLIGFAGAPWTVATYMIAGAAEREQIQARLFAYRQPDLFQRVIDRLTDTTIAYLDQQITAGAETVKLFDSWAGALAPAEFRRWCIAPAARIVSALKTAHPDVPVIGFPRGCGGLLAEYVTATGVDIVALDTGVDPAWAHEVLPAGMPVQGNLDPLALIAGGEPLEAAVTGILAALGDRPHVFNLGHGILPQTPPEHVTELLRLVRQG